MLNRLKKIFESFQKHEVRYLVIGGIASMLYGVPRYGDLSSDGKTIINTCDLPRVFLTEPDKKRNSITREICRYKFRSTK